MSEEQTQALLAYLVVPHTSKEVRQWAFERGIGGPVELLLELEVAGRVVKYQPLTGPPTYRAATAGDAVRQRRTPRGVPIEEEDEGEEELPQPDRRAAIAAVAKRLNRAAERRPAPPAVPIEQPKPEPPASPAKEITMAKTCKECGKEGSATLRVRGGLCKECRGKAKPAAKKPARGGKRHATPRPPSGGDIIERLRWEAEGVAKGFLTHEELGRRVVELLGAAE